MPIRVSHPQKRVLQTRASVVRVVWVYPGAVVEIKTSVLSLECTVWANSLLVMYVVYFL